MELTNGSAIVFKMTDRAVAQMSLQNHIDKDPSFALTWIAMPKHMREEALQTRLRSLQNWRKE